jgi:hypothetical protein
LLFDSGKIHVIERKYITISEELPDTCDPTEGAIEPALQFTKSVYKRHPLGPVTFDETDALCAVGFSHRFKFDGQSFIMIISSLINHSCDANLSLSRDGKWFSWQAVTDIVLDTQLTVW